MKNETALTRGLAGVPAEAEPAGRPIPTDQDAMLYGIEAAYLLGLSIRTLEAYRVRGGGPEYCLLSARAVRYRRSDVLAWAASKRRSSTSEGAGAAR